MDRFFSRAMVNRYLQKTMRILLILSITCELRLRIE
jgi:hypothetical protein